MEELTFTYNQSQKAYIATYEATENFAFHINRASEGPFYIKQLSVTDSTFTADDAVDVRDCPVYHDKKIDDEFIAEVYPKLIVFVSFVQVQKAAIATNS